MTKFSTDKQTLIDLNIFPQAKGDLSVFDFYNSTKTKGGRDELEKMIRTPLNDLEEINARISAIKYICNNPVECELDNEYLDFIEHYLNQNTLILKDNFLNSIESCISYQINPSNEYYIILKGLEFLKSHLNILSDYLKAIDKSDMPEFFNQLLLEFEGITKSAEFKLFLNPPKGKFTFRQINQFDFLIRSQKKEEIKRILQLSYQLDAYLSIANTSKIKELGFPILTKAPKPYLKIDGFFHPFIASPIRNDIELADHKNLCFVSGANMAGKSTSLKAVGLCVYLAHVGFPVPAREMEVSLFNGLYSTINISDDINKGYSHYYSEVRRVKDIALQIKEKKKVLVIFDELFRGTNVKDAFDATLMVSKGFTKIKDCLFFISTHIVEVAQELEKLDSVDFKCFESHLMEGKPIYNYKLINGISTERLGVTILKNEKIMEIIDQILND
ncbi:MutS-related protein [Labilibaculum euxinus]|uniref:DNA mismatch repair proteins mutS family domain-containing protein n=1 Tax=Labilibaculum euxinus TaxID=2686357 RepID=A0A7M4D8H3_9BACT|nr:hypothetical protein [Labilibaculum euxinus]MUP38952.1 hypothetical protein [Labilibaculum euxinus]MVB08157.1 hypothetical protein [Labilibaculum euxinus]